MVVGALRRFAATPILKWNTTETTWGGPCHKIAWHVSVSCICYVKQSPPFPNRESVSLPGRKFRLLYDVSYDPTDPMSPLPLYAVPTTFAEPAFPMMGQS